MQRDISNRVVAIGLARHAGQRGAVRLPDAVLMHGDIDPTDSMIIERLDALEEGRRDRERTAAVVTAPVQQSVACGTFPAIGERRTDGDGLRGIATGGVGRVVREPAAEGALTLESVVLHVALYVAAVFALVFILMIGPIVALCASVAGLVVCPVLYTVRQLRRCRVPSWI